MQLHNYIKFSIEKLLLVAECQAHDASVSESMEYINAAAIADLEGLLTNETEDYTYENTNAAACQV